MENSISLNELPEEHPLRNTKLCDLDVFYRGPSTRAWQQVLPSYNISKVTYNELGDVWKENQEWVVDTEAWDEDRVDTIGQNGNNGEHYV